MLEHLSDKTTKNFIRSFVRREKKLNLKQANIYQTLATHYCLIREADFINPLATFQQAGPLTLEIGFGKGHSLFKQAQTHPTHNYLGIEVYRTGVATLLTQLAIHPLKNLKLFTEDAVDILTSCITDQSLDNIQIFFPDPWPKTRHHKRRLIQAPFLHLLHKKLKLGGRLHLATDWEPYAAQMLTLLETAQGWRNQAPAYQFLSNASTLRPLTLFEKKGLAKGHPILDLCFIKE
jgi:tRNA (guanine-N7-)-methyltransferase